MHGLLYRYKDDVGVYLRSVDFSATNLVGRGQWYIQANEFVLRRDDLWTARFCRMNRTPYANI